MGRRGSLLRSSSIFIRAWRLGLYPSSVTARLRRDNTDSVGFFFLAHSFHSARNPTNYVIFRIGKTYVLRQYPIPTYISLTRSVTILAHQEAWLELFANPSLGGSGPIAEPESKSQGSRKGRNFCVARETSVRGRTNSAVLFATNSNWIFGVCPVHCPA